MPANRFNGFTEYGIGIGLRAPHYNHILTRKPVCDWFEIISENFMIDGGRPLHILDEILEQYKVVQHGVSMYFGSAEKPNREHLRRLRDYVNSVPAERVAQIHIAGHCKYRKYILDTHDHPVIDPVWKLYERAIQRVGHTATLLEWDDSIPSFEEVHDEALKANRFLSSTVLATAV